MASSLAKLAPCRLVVRRTFVEFESGDRPDFAPRCRFFSDPVVRCYSITVADHVDRKSERDDLSDAKTEVASTSSSSTAASAESSDAESQASHGAAAAQLGSLFSYPSPLMSWLPAGVPDDRSGAQVFAQEWSCRAECSKPVHPTQTRTDNEETLSPKTSVLLRNIPNNYTRKLLLELLDREGFACQYDFVYLPIDTDKRASKGFAYINLQDPATALRFFASFEGYRKWATPSSKIGGVSWGGMQGLQAYVDRYRSSSIMDCRDECQPVMFSDGVRVPFPARR